MQKAEATFCVFVKEMGNDVFVFLRFLDREERAPEAFIEAAVFFFFAVVCFLRFHVAVNCHKTCHSAHVSISEAFQ